MFAAVVDAHHAGEDDDKVHKSEQVHMLKVSEAEKVDVSYLSLYIPVVISDLVKVATLGFCFTAAAAARLGQASFDALSLLASATIG